MSRIIHNADISYSSINAPNFKQAQNENCCRTCFLNFPYATITSTLLVIAGLVISITSIFHLIGIVDRLSQDLFYKHLPWSNEFKVVLFFLVGFVSVIILINLIIGFATSFLRFDGKPTQKMCYCSRNSTTNCLIRFIALLNQLIFVLIFVIFILFTLITFTLYILRTLCNSVQISNELEKTFDNTTTSTEQYQQSHSINLRPFANLLELQSNETNLLVFEDIRLKTLCRDYISTLILYDLISFLGIFLLFIGFYCYSINLTVNRIRIATYKKYTELLYLSNCTEMNAFNDASFENATERF
ncbi:hypothetical protein SSS_00997 [Sarcoptes scabiei]|uniref:Uncharacterized protein n=1 Tax=Sarcoptes scabiei TaxID=52283 RepID=A0A834R1U2_SARSC|nr:hypothetical protein SSS_00997 [Sarcoptes scabiei]UXI17002.1 hypothetical protein NH340_JMT02945 [Sarcoptes scabiei]